MNAKDHKRVAEIKTQADKLLNDSGLMKEWDLLNIDVVEALLGDLNELTWGNDPKHLQNLTLPDEAKK